MAVKSHMAIEPGMKVAAQMACEPSEEDFQFVQQMGVECAVIWVDAAKASADTTRRGVMISPVTVSSFTVWAITVCTMSPRSRSICPGATKKSKSTSGISAI